MRQRKKVICKEEFGGRFEDFEVKGWIQDRDGRFLCPVVRMPRHSHGLL